MTVRTTDKRRALLAPLFIAWILTVGFGIRSLLTYSNTPGTIATPPANWPSNAGVGHVRGKDSLLLFAHPECACSRATLGELAHIAACCGDRVDTTVVFLMPKGDPSGWEQSGLIEEAAGIPRVRTVLDPGGSIARRFGARTSGQTLLYDGNGRLVFNGGITASRGHSGDNDGRETITSILLRQPARRSHLPVFGCALFSGE